MIRSVPYMCGDVQYCVYECGSVYRYTKKMPTHRDGSGYVIVRLGGTRRPLHRVVADAFMPLADTAGLVVDHVNGIRHDNRLCNLAWATVSQNRRNSTYGKRRPVTEPDKAAIRHLAMAGSPIRDMVEVTGLPGPKCEWLARELCPTWRP